MALQVSPIRNSSHVSSKLQYTSTLSRSIALESPYTSKFFSSTVTLSVLGGIIFLIATTIFFFFAFAICLFIVVVMVATAVVIAGVRDLGQHTSVVKLSSRYHRILSESQVETSMSAQSIHRAPMSQLSRTSSVRSQCFDCATVDNDYEMCPNIETDTYPRTDGSAILSQLLLAPTDFRTRGEEARVAS
ncbi:hypothetical protein V1508DRAFT_417191 [Lipomyces doorenjongii]|uniref:uncharacterized protein n=1 Tax=Lipomyces doorenjongii TaxID=383834 RepID=UPI0034CE3D4F